MIEILIGLTVISLGLIKLKHDEEQATVINDTTVSN